MVNILEQYFVQYHELILTDIGTLQFTHQPAQWVENTLHAPSSEIIFVEDKKKPNIHFYQYLAEALSINKEKATLEFEQFLKNSFEAYGSTLSIGNLGHLKKIGSNFTWVSTYVSSQYYKDIAISPIEHSAPIENRFLLSWQWIAVILAFLAVIAIVYKSL